MVSLSDGTFGALFDREEAARTAVRIGAVIAFVVVWWLLSKYGLAYGNVDTARWPTPIEVLDMTRIMLTEKLGQSVAHSWTSLYRVLVGFVLATVLGVPLGLGIGVNRFVEDATFPVIELLRPIPPLAWIPVILIVFGIQRTMYFITFIGAFFPIVLNTIAGASSVQEVEVRAARCLGASRRKIFLEVIVPKSLPSIFTGLAIGMGISWISIVAAEMVAGKLGLGYLVWSSYNTLEYSRVVFGMIALGLLGYGCSASIRYFGDWAMPWREFTGGMQQ